MERKDVKTGLWGAVGGAIALTIIGFTWLGWVGESKAQSMVADAAENAVIARLAPICVAQYGLDPDKVAKLKVMKAKDSWSRGDFVGEQGWSTMIGEKEPDSQVSRKCAELLSTLNG
jgi:hypothetical protein